MSEVVSRRDWKEIFGEWVVIAEEYDDLSKDAAEALMAAFPNKANFMYHQGVIKEVIRESLSQAKRNLYDETTEIMENTKPNERTPEQERKIKQRTTIRGQVNRLYNRMLFGKHFIILALYATLK
jgi:hypothetical protein